MKCTAPAFISAAAIFILTAIIAPLSPAAGLPSGRESGGTLYSGTLGEEIAYRIYLPGSYDGGETRYPVIYLIEGDLYFRFITGVTDTYSRIGKMPEVIVVGVGTGDRWRDFTPTRADLPDGAAMPQSGGAPKYLAFLTDDMMPYIDGRFRTRPYAVLCGHSLAGLAAVYAMTAGTGPFDACIATSPSLWWDGEMMTSRVRDLAGRGEGLPGTIFLACGNEGETVQAPIERFRDVLAGGWPGGPAWEYRQFPEADHQEVPVKAFSFGLDLVFGDWRVPASVIDGGFDRVVEYYETLSARYGYPVPVPESTANRLGYIALGRGDIDLAIRIFEWNTREYPRSANVWDSLAEACLRSGDRERARDLYRKALEIDPGSASARKMLEELKD